MKKYAQFFSYLCYNNLYSNQIPIMARKVKLLIALKKRGWDPVAGRQTIAVMLTLIFDVNLASFSHRKENHRILSDFSRGQYAPHEGLDRRLALLDRKICLPRFSFPEDHRRISGCGEESCRQRAGIGYHGMSMTAFWSVC